MHQVMVELWRKTARLVTIVNGTTPGRTGECTPAACETLDGRKGAACCTIGYHCPCLKEDACAMYPVRPPNCRAFPRTPEDLTLVKNCGYSWTDGT